MDPTEIAILESCANDFRPLKPLTRQIPRGTLYRHVNRLLRLGWLRREGDLYLTTEGGQRQLIEAQGGRQWDTIERLYPPLGLVPTPVHKSMIELNLAAVVARKHETRLDRHPVFIYVGGTLLWKTSAGIFVCHALGLDPALTVVDFGAESGRSLTVRRSSSGELVFKRELLDALFVVLDEFQAAEPAVRKSSSIFLSGRLIVPFENEQLKVRPVPLLTLNPRGGDTLEEKLGLSPPQIRRAIIADLDAVPMPDLATSGQEALAAAQAHPPIALSPPSVNCEAYRRQVVDLVRDILLPEATEQVDVEVVLNLSTGMTAFIPEPAEAIAQVCHALGTVLETLAWTRPGWIQPVTDFSLEPKRRQRREEIEQGAANLRALPSNSLAHQGPTPQSMNLQLPRIQREPVLPSLTLSDEIRGRLAWLAVETGCPTEEVILLLISHYTRWRKDPQAVAMLYKSLVLARSLRVNEVAVETLDAYLSTAYHLKKYGCTFGDVPEALKLIEQLANLPVHWNWRIAEEVMKAIAYLLENGISPQDVVVFLQEHHKLKALGFDEETAKAVGSALDREGAVGAKRDRVLRRMVRLAGKVIDAAELENERQRLESEVSKLKAEQPRHEDAIQKTKHALEDLMRKEVEARERLDQTDAQCAAKEQNLEVLRGFRAFLLGRSPRTDAIWRDLEYLLELRRSGQIPEESYAMMLSDRLQKAVVPFIQEIMMETEQPT